MTARLTHKSSPTGRTTDCVENLVTVKCGGGLKATRENKRSEQLFMYEIGDDLPADVALPHEVGVHTPHGSVRLRQRKELWSLLCRLCLLIRAAVFSAQQKQNGLLIRKTVSWKQLWTANTAFFRGHQRVGTPEYLSMMQLRKIWAEGSFSVLKRAHCSSKIRKRGSLAAPEECLLAAMALNLKRMAKCHLSLSLNLLFCWGHDRFQQNFYVRQQVQ